MKDRSVMKILVMDRSSRESYVHLPGPDMICILGVSFLEMVESELGFSPRHIQSIHGTVKIIS